MPLPPTHTEERLPSRAVLVASYVLMGLGLLLVLHQGLLPGLLCACVGFLATRWLARGLTRLAVRPGHPAQMRCTRVMRITAAVVIGLAPLALLSLALSHSRTFVLHAPEQYRELLDHVARTVLELRDKLPAELGMHLPAGADDVQELVAHSLRAQAGVLAVMGRAWLQGLLFSYVGLLVGVLAACGQASAGRRRPLAAALHARILRFATAFRQIIAAQVWIAAFNSVLTALFLYGLLPFWDMRLPYTGPLVALTFLAGLVPIVGNLLCNAVITMVGLSVSPLTAAACLAFLIVIHKAEYAINAKVVGARTHMAVWELLAVMFVAEAVFGPAGLVAAPLYYAYLKKELQAARLV